MEVSAEKPKVINRITLFILIAMVAGIGLGFTLNKVWLADQNNKLEQLEIALLQPVHADDSLASAEQARQKIIAE